jgi:hypothetical protein
MILQGARRRAWNRAYAGGRGYLRYAAAYRGTGRRRRTAQPLTRRGVERRWWHRVMDDRDLLGTKLLLLAALLGLTALLERVV